MYSNLDKLKDELKDVNSATQATRVYEQIKREEDCIRKEEKEKQKQINDLLAGAKASIDQVSILQDNYDTLKELYDTQVESNEETRKEIIHNHMISTISIIIAILSLLVAAATLIVTVCRSIQ